MTAELHAREHYLSQSTIHLGDYQLRLQRDNLAAIRLFVAVPITVQPSDIGGAYDLTALPLKRWYVVHDRRGFKLPVAVRRLERFSIQVRVDGLLPTHLPSIPCIGCNPSRPASMSGGAAVKTAAGSRGITRSARRNKSAGPGSSPGEGGNEQRQKTGGRPGIPPPTPEGSWP